MYVGTRDGKNVAGHLWENVDLTDRNAVATRWAQRHAKLLNNTGDDLLDVISPSLSSNLAGVA